MPIDRNGAILSDILEKIESRLEMDYRSDTFTVLFPKSKAELLDSRYFLFTVLCVSGKNITLRDRILSIEGITEVLLHDGKTIEIVDNPNLTEG